MVTTALEGEALPADGRLPAPAWREAAARPFGLYLHVPFCARRCGYCDFNTYTLAQWGGLGPRDYLRWAHAELAFAQRCLAASRPDGGGALPPLSTVFVGGGTPTLLSPAQLGELLADARDRFGLAGGAEVTVEANPETIEPGVLAGLLDAGVTRLSLGMQSAVPRVLAVLDRLHTPGQALRAARAARAAGFADVGLDLIYGTPTETAADWRASLEAALSVAPDHVSAYALVVEAGTPLARRIGAGAVPPPDDDDLADKYLLAERVLTEAGLTNYEISNWARPGHECRHNLAYWRGDTWWGVGPGAHSHAGGFRWWNHRAPRRWGEALDAGAWPAEACETLGEAERHEERVLLELRLAGGLPLAVLSRSERDRLDGLAGAGLVVVGADERARLTLRGRLLADKVTRDLLD